MEARELAPTSTPRRGLLHVKEPVGWCVGVIGHLVAEVVGVDREVDVRVVSLGGQHPVELRLELGERWPLADRFVPTRKHNLVPIVSK